MIASIPLMIIPLIVYNAILFAPALGQDFGALSSAMFSVEMISGAMWTMDLSALLVTAALFLRRFVTAKSWLHFDIFAWTASAKPGRPEGGEAMGLRAVYAAIVELTRRGSKKG